MGWQQNLFPLLIITAGPGFSGEFIYAPTTGAGNLIASSTANVGTDPFGNVYLGGVSTYQKLSDTFFYALNFQGSGGNGIQFYRNPGPGMTGGWATTSSSSILQLPGFSGNVFQMFGLITALISSGQVVMSPAGATAAGTTAFLEVDGATAFKNQALPAGVSGFGILLANGSQLQAIDGADLQNYKMQRRMLEATGQTLTGSAANVNGWGAITLAARPYHIRGRLVCIPIVANGAVVFTISATGGIGATAQITFREVITPAALGVITWGNGLVNQPLGTVFTCTTVGAALANREVEFDFKITVTTAGTITPQVSNTIPADTIGVSYGSIEILPE